MPYIKQSKRLALNKITDSIDSQSLYLTSGDINYLITYLINTFTNQQGPCYNTFATASGILDNAKQEYYRRVMSPYEDEKIKENGDVY